MLTSQQAVTFQKLGDINFALSVPTRVSHNAAPDGEILMATLGHLGHNRAHHGHGKGGGSCHVHPLVGIDRDVLGKIGDFAILQRPDVFLRQFKVGAFGQTVEVMLKDPLLFHDHLGRRRSRQRVRISAR